MTTTERDRIIAWHDQTCPEGAHCRDDISTYPTPPDDWHPRRDEEKR